MSVGEAVVDRWDNASLDSTIASLDFGDDDADQEETALPRAQYELLSESNASLSKGYRIQRQPVRFQVWLSTAQGAQDAIEAIDAAFTNSEAAITNPLAIPVATGSVIGCEKTSSTVLTEVHGRVYRGIIQFDVDWHKKNVIPS